MSMNRRQKIGDRFRARPVGGIDGDDGGPGFGQSYYVLDERRYPDRAVREVAFDEADDRQGASRCNCGDVRPSLNA